jgi:pyruvate dehydrogenase E1 component alpha subunit
VTATVSRGRKPAALDAETAGRLRGFLRQMMLIRHFEERAGEAYSLGLIGGFCHLYIGQEAVAIGTIPALRDDDYVISAYREHGHALARGVPARAVMAELFGKATGSSHGKGGSMHIFDADRHFLGGHGIVGSHIALAAGHAFASKYRGQDSITLCFFGEAAANIGAFHETLNMAGLWKLPVVFVCENNFYGMGTALHRAAAIEDLHQRAASYGMPGEAVDGQDVVAVREAMDRAAARARADGTPTLLEIRTYRYVGHSMSDAVHGTYRTKEEVEEHKRRDPIRLLAELLRERGGLEESEVDEMEAAVKAEVQDAWDFAEQSPDPDPSALFTDVYAPEA